MTLSTMPGENVYIDIAYKDGAGVFQIDGDVTHPSWVRLVLAARNASPSPTVEGNTLSMEWPSALELIREFGTGEVQRSYSFRLRPVGDAARLLKEFSDQIREVRRQKVGVPGSLSHDEIEQRLVALGFTRRKLKPFQLRDLQHLLALTNGANFSVPGAGKTSVALALNLLTRRPGHHLLVVAPKSATQAWKDVVSDCMQSDAPDGGAQDFVVLEGSGREIANAFVAGGSRFIISYDMMIRNQRVIAQHLARVPTHLILDESHRMKAGAQSQRGAFLLKISTLPVRRDILSGTPMPQSSSDLESQLDFLWPGHGLGSQVERGAEPREVLGKLYVRTTKNELGLREPIRHFVDRPMSSSQLALYSIVRSEFLRLFARSINKAMGQPQLLRARRSVMRLLQLSTNPALALGSMTSDGLNIESAIVDEVLEEQYSPKMIAVMEKARELAREGKKSVIWTIFTGTIESLGAALADLNPVVVYGAVPSGDQEDENTREGRIKKFHVDDSCSVLIANPAAAGEGISLHQVCHDALYLDRSYVSTHYLQSIDRIHRLGMDPQQDTNIYVYRSKAPAEIGSIDLSVSRRLAEKIRNMQRLLDDDDLHQLALDEEDAQEPLDYDIEIQDLMDLLAEFEGKASPIAVQE